jgi:Mn2+/Fe2+ NRAMP family transporter
MDPFLEACFDRCASVAGQVIMQGFVGFSIPVWVRHLITMVPAFIVALSFSTMTAMIVSQVVLSLVLPLPMVALVILSSNVPHGAIVQFTLPLHPGIESGRRNGAADELSR